MNTAMTTMAFVCAVATTCAQAQFAPTGKFPAQPVVGAVPDQTRSPSLRPLPFGDGENALNFSPAA